MSDGWFRSSTASTFVVSDSRGDIEASLTDPTGLFSFDTRFLSKWILTLDGERLNPLSVDDLQYFETRFFLVPGTGTVYVDAKLSVIRRRAVGDGFHEELTTSITTRSRWRSPFGSKLLPISPTSSRSRTRSRRKGRTRQTSTRARCDSATRGTYRRETSIFLRPRDLLDETGLTPWLRSSRTVLDSNT